MNLEHYKIYPEIALHNMIGLEQLEIDEYEYDVCIKHPAYDLHTLCGCKIDQTPDGEPEETKEKITCEFCIETINAIKELNEKEINNG